MNNSTHGQSYNSLLTVTDLAKQLQLSVNSIYRRRSLGEALPPVIKIGSALRWRRDDVDAWIAQQRERLC